VRQVHRRAVTWLTRKGHAVASSEARSQDAPAQTSLEACAAIAMGRGAVRAIRDVTRRPSSGPLPGSKRRPSTKAPSGFNLHASVAVAAGDDLGREQLMRYGARPPLALDRLRRLPGGRAGCWGTVIPPRPTALRPDALVRPWGVRRDASRPRLRH
jgi:hypothetical protein